MEEEAKIREEVSLLVLNLTLTPLCQIHIERLAMIPLTRSILWGPLAYAIMGGLLIATAL